MLSFVKLSKSLYLRDAAGARLCTTRAVKTYYTRMQRTIQQFTGLAYSNQIVSQGEAGERTKQQTLPPQPRTYKKIVRSHCFDGKMLPVRSEWSW